MWGGRFAEGPDALVEKYTESVSYDRILFRQDIAGSMAHARMLARQGIITKEEGRTLCDGLQAVREEMEAGTFAWTAALEDVHMNIESRLTEIVGDVGKKLHTGRSRNDQVALDFRLFVSDSVRNWGNLLKNLVAVLADRAEENKKVLLPGYTHMQPAQPVSLAQHLLAYAAMFHRDAARLRDADRRIRICPLGAAALAGTTYPVDPAFVAEELGMYGVFSNSMDAVSDRDFALEAMFCGSLIMAHLSRLCEDIILWANPSFGYVRLPDSYSTGSSIMPQKKNPDVAELMRGKTGRAYGALLSLLTTMKGLPMTYNRDLQEDKVPFLDLDRTVDMSLRLMAGMMRELGFVPDRMREALNRGFLNATELADYLVGKGMAFREAHRCTGRAVAEAERRGMSLETLPLDSLRAICPLADADVYAVLDFDRAVARRESTGGTGPQSVGTQILFLRNWLNRAE
jgi:argininosuccinate lyase